MKNNLFLLLSSIVLITSCAEKLTSDSVEQGQITFSTQIDTRVIGNSFENNDYISVEAFTNSDFTGSIASNVKYYYSNGNFVSDNPISYSIGSTQKVTFRAVYPFLQGVDHQFQFSVKADQSADQNYTLSDLMVAEVVATDSKTPVLNFSRALSQVVVEVRDHNGNAVDDAVVTVSGATSTNIELNQGTYTATGGVSEVTAADNGNGSYKVILPAQTILAANDFVKVTVDGETTVEKVDADFILESGNSYNYDITLKDSQGEPVHKYADGEVVEWQRESAGAPEPVHLIFIGDGYIEDDYLEGGKFDTDVNTAIDAFFAVEPYTTYRDYFRVSSVAAYSNERGADVLNAISYDNIPEQTKDTKFDAALEGGGSTGVSCNYNLVYSYAKRVPDVFEEQLKGTTVYLLINLDAYAGTCMMEYYGRSVSMCPVGSSFRSIVQHEGGGHGFGRLLDEYRYYEENLPESEKGFTEGWRKREPYFGNNIDYTGSRSQVHWNKYFSLSGYDAVGLYEGAALYYYNAWRSESISCMEDNRPYFNAPSREAIVYRICQSSGTTFSFDDFVANDRVKSDPDNYRAPSLTPPAEFRPLGRPIFVDNR